MATWYRTGTAAFTNGSTTVTGTGTAWAANARTGDALHAPDGRAYEIASVSSDTEITLAIDYLGSTTSGQDYAIQPTRGITVEFNDNAVALLSTVQDYVDTALAGRFGNGSVGSPSLSFSGDTDTGFYRPDANEIAAATGGVRRTLLSSSAYQIDVPITGTAVQSDSMDDTSGRLLTVGAGGLLDKTESVDDWDTFDKSQRTNLNYNVTSSTSNNPWDDWMALLTFYRSGDRVGFLGMRTLTEPHAQIGYYDGTNTEVEDIWHTGNTTVDGSGFLLEASPIVRVYTDSISEPVKPVGATLTHSETGVYVLSGVPPLATEGWQVRTPEDVNGNKVVAIDPPEYDADAGTLTLRTYDLLWHEGRLVPGDRMDVPGDYFVMLRFHEEPADDEVEE